MKLFLAGLLLSSLATVGAMRHTSVTFDETFMIPAGARGFQTGQFEAMEHPPVVQYLYGAPVYLSRPNFPVERHSGWQRGMEFVYGRGLLWLSRNDPEQLTFRARLVAAVIAAALSLAVYLFAARFFGRGVALLAGILTAFLPDVLAHGGIAYNDVPAALVILAAVWAGDTGVRRPSAKRGLLAGALTAVAIGTKLTAIALFPIALLLAAAEGLHRRFERGWALALARAAAVGVVAGYLALVLVFRGDFTLAELYDKGLYNLIHASAGHSNPGYLLGRFIPTGTWYFFPVAFLFKTPAALHVLMLLAAAGFWLTRRPAAWRERLVSPLRAPVVALLVLGGFLLTARLNIGFRHALPALPFLCVLVAVGVVRLWGMVGRRVRVAVVALVLWFMGSSLSYYPHFLAYMSEYLPARDRGYEVLVDSSLDWGQELLHLRDFMRENEIPRVYLSYFGSALPAGYGIDYLPLRSFLEPLPRPLPAGQPKPEWEVISATHLAGAYLAGDPYAPFREVRPDYVLGHSLFVYHVEPGR